MSHVTHVDESCHICESVMNEACKHLCHTSSPWAEPVLALWQWVMSHTSMSHVTCTKESCNTRIAQRTFDWNPCLLYVYDNESCHTCEWAISHRWMCFVMDLDESEWVMSSICMSHFTHVNEACHTYEWGVSHIWISHMTRMNESCHTHECGESHVWMSHVTHMNESCPTYESVMWHIWMSQVTPVNESCHTASRPSAAPHSYPWIWMRHVTHMDTSCVTHKWVTSHVWMRHVTHVNTSYLARKWVTPHMCTSR